MLRQKYPDAEATPDGNFIYTDEAGEKRLFNASGLDVGDIIELTRPGIETLGAAGGAVAGAPLGISGMLAGAGLGGTAAGQVTDLTMKALGYPVSAGPLEQVRDVGADFLTNVTGEAGGMALQALPRAVGRMVASPEAAAVGQAAARRGIRPSTGMVTGPATSSVENMIARVLPGSKAAREQVRVFNEVADAARGAVPGVPGGVMEGREAAGAALKTGVSRSYTRFRQVRQRLDDQVYSLMPRDAAVPTTELANTARALEAEIAAAPEALEPTLGPVLRQMRETLASADRYGGSLPLETQRQIKTLRFQQKKPDPMAKVVPKAQQWLDRAYDAMRGDLRTAAKNQSPAALRALDRHDRLVVGFRGEDLGRESIADSLDTILKANSDKDAYSALLAPSGGVNRMRQVLGRLNDSERRVVARATWDNMLTTPQGNFNLNRLLGQWTRASPATRQELFGRVANTGEIDDLMTVIGGMREADRSRNFSNTAYTLMQASLGERAIGEIMTKVAGVSGGASAIGGGLIPVETLGYVAAPYLLSEVIHRPGVARAIADAASGRPMQMTETVRRAVGRAVARALGDELGEEEEASPIPMLPGSAPMSAALLAQ